MPLISQIEKLSEIKIKRQALLLDIRSQISDYDFNFDFNSFAEKINDRENTSFKTRGYLIQLLSKIIQFKPNFKDRGLILVKRILEDEEKRKTDSNTEVTKIKNQELLSENLNIEDNYNQERFFIIKSILFFYFIVDYRILINFNISEDENELLHIRNRFLFVDYNGIDRKFEIPKNDIIGFNNRIISFERIQNNVMDSLELSKFKFLSDFILFTAEFPFLNRLSFIKKWAGFDSNKKNNSANSNNNLIDDELFYKTITDSQLFVYDNNDLLIYDPQERVKADKFVNNREERLKISSEIHNRLELKKKEKLLKSFISNYVKTSDYIDTNRGICLKGFSGQIISNKFISNLLSLSNNKKLTDLVNNLIDRFYNNNNEISNGNNNSFVLINGLCFKIEVSDLIVGENDILGKIIVFDNVIEKLLLLNNIYYLDYSYIMMLPDKQKLFNLDFIYNTNNKNKKNISKIDKKNEDDKLNLYKLFKKVIICYKNDFLKLETEISMDSSSFDSRNKEHGSPRFKDFIIQSLTSEKNIYEALKLLFHLIIIYYKSNKKNNLNLIFNNDNENLIKISIITDINIIDKSYNNGSILTLIDNEFKYDSMLNLIFLSNYFQEVFDSQFIVKEEFNFENEFIGTSFNFEIKV